MTNSSVDRSEVVGRLTAAELLANQGYMVHAESVYKTILKQAEMAEGEGPLTGLVLLNLHDFYCNQKRQDEADPVWERIRRILIRLSKV